MNLFHGSLVRLAAANPETDPEIMARWQRDTEYMRLLDTDPARPETAKEIKEWLEKDEGKDFRFMIHALADDRLLGFVGLFRPSWNNGDTYVGIGIGDRDDWGKGYGTDAMKLALRYAFTELNLHRVTLLVFEHNPRARRSYEKAGFVFEGRVRGDCHRDSQRLNTLWMGILREEWEKQNSQLQSSNPQF